MAFYEVNRSANASNKMLSLKSSLVAAMVEAEQIQREASEMTEDQIRTHFGFDATMTQAAFNTTIDGVVTALQAAAVDNYISQVG